MIPTCDEVSWYPLPGYWAEAERYEEAERTPWRAAMWLCEGSKRYPHVAVIVKGQHSRCRQCGFNRRQLFANEELVVMGEGRPTPT